MNLQMAVKLGGIGVGAAAVGTGVGYGIERLMHDGAQQRHAAATAFVDALNANATGEIPEGVRLATVTTEPWTHVSQIGIASAGMGGVLLGTAVKNPFALAAKARVIGGALGVAGLAATAGAVLSYQRQA